MSASPDEEDLPWRGLTERDLWPGEPLRYLEGAIPDLSTPRAAAGAYAALGWPVLPIWPMVEGRCACGSPDCRSPAKHPLGKLAPHGLKDSTTEPERIRRWWRDWPAANVAVRTGPESGLLVLDVDGPEGERTLVELERRHGDLPELFPMQWTGGGRGGWQAFLAYPEGRQIASKAGALGRKLDYRGAGGYVLLPPAFTAEPYRWAADRSPWDLPPEPAPDWLVNLLDPPESLLPEQQSAWPGHDRQRAALSDRYLERAISAELALVASAPNGRRNEQLNESAFNLFRFAAEGRIAAGSLGAALAAAARHAGLGEREIASTLRSAATKRGAL